MHRRRHRSGEFVRYNQEHLGRSFSSFSSSFSSVSSFSSSSSSSSSTTEFYLVLDGVQAHWDASDLSSLNDGATLSSSDWVDKSGNERGALAPLGTVTYQATGLSDTYPCLYLSGSSTGLDTGGGTNYVRQTIVMVFRWDECNCLGTCGKAVHYLWDWRDEWGLSYLHGNHHNSGKEVRVISG